MGCYNSTVVNAPVEKVWAALRDFHNLSCLPNVVEDVKKVGDPSGTQVGAKRVVNGVFHETLIALDDHDRVLRYTIDDGPDAVSKDNVQGYIGEVRAYPVTEDSSNFVTRSTKLCWVISRRRSLDLTWIGTYVFETSSAVHNFTMRKGCGLRICLTQGAMKLII